MTNHLTREAIDLRIGFLQEQARTGRRPLEVIWHEVDRLRALRATASTTAENFTAAEQLERALAAERLHQARRAQ